MKTLTKILADTDILWSPFRDLDRHNYRPGGAIAERRDQYTRHGVPFVVGGDAASRMAGSRQLAEYRSKGLVRLFGSGRNRGVRLTPKGEAVARSLTACHVVSDPEPWAMLEAIAAVPFKRTNAGCVLEVHLVDSQYDQPRISYKLNRLEQMALPLITAGWLDAASDTEGRIGYSITDEGRAALAKGPPDLGELPGMDDDDAELYDELLKAGLAERQQWKPDRNVVWIPLSAGMWPGRPEGLGCLVPDTTEGTGNA